MSGSGPITWCVVRVLGGVGVLQRAVLWLAAETGSSAPVSGYGLVLLVLLVLLVSRSSGTCSTRGIEGATSTPAEACALRWRLPLDLGDMRCCWGQPVRWAWPLNIVRSGSSRRS
jgi:hypothetical protein